MKKQTRIILATLVLLTGYILARPFAHITIDEAGAYLFYRDSTAEKYNGVVLW